MLGLSTGRWTSPFDVTLVNGVKLERVESAEDHLIIVDAVCRLPKTETPASSQ